MTPVAEGDLLEDHAGLPIAPSLPRFMRNPLGRDFAVGDIHGCFTELTRALDTIGFDGRVDRLFSVGDLVDRGPESHHVLHWLEQPWFHAICGNHDFLAWHTALGVPYPAVDHLAHGGSWLALLPQNLQHRIGERLAALPLALEIETASGTVALVHADCPFDDWRAMQAVRWDAIDPAGALADCCLWSFERHRRHYAEPIRNIRAVVHGHLVVPTVEILGNVYFIDTGGWRPGGCFTFLELHTLTAISGPANTRVAVNRRNR